jgi:amino acid transporter
MPFDRDIEMNTVAAAKAQSLGHGIGNPNVHQRPATVRSGSFVQQFVDSFRRDDIGSSHDWPGRRPGTGSVPSGSRDKHGVRYYDLSTANARTAGSSLSRELKGRHLQMIAIGGSIGEC